MTALALLPPIPKPPHDPTSWLLNPLVGWRQAELFDKKQTPVSQSPALTLKPANERSLAEDSGSFGGLALPPNMALGPDGGLYLLDRTRAELKRFDPCECDFQAVPCFGGTGSGPRQLNGPNGIGICSGNLFVCDTKNHRLSIFSLHGFVLRGHWRPPASAYAGPDPQLINDWEPFDLAFDGRGQVYVTDIANGCIHRFSSSGQWEQRLAGFVQVSSIAIDCRDRIYVIVEDPAQGVRVVNTDGKSAAVVSSPKELSQVFPALPFEVDAGGLLHLGLLCTDLDGCECKDSAAAQKCRPNQTAERGVFDLDGNVVECSTASGALSYFTSGSYFSHALDSEFYRCQWHRIIVRGEIPAGARVTVSTYSAEALLTDDQVQGLDGQWETNQTAGEMLNGEWDCLVRSGGGRFLWINLELRGNGKVTPRIDSIEIEFPRISVRRFLPAVFGEEPVSADFTDRFLSLFDTTIRSIETEVDREAGYFDPLSAPAERDPKTGIDFLSWLASWIGLTLDRHWPEARRRRFLKEAGRLFDLRGTREGLWRELLLFLDVEPENWCEDGRPRDRCTPAPVNCGPIPRSSCDYDCKEVGALEDCAPREWQPPPLILEHFKLRRWLFLGAGRLGEQAELWGKRIVNRSQLDDGAQIGHTQLVTTQDPLRDPFHVYAHKFTVFLPACYQRSEQQRKAIENLLRNGRPAGTLAQVQYVEPRFRIGFQSMIGFDSVVGRYPSGTTLNETALGRASVLTAPPHKEGGPSLEIGNQSRIGSTTKLE